MGHCRSVFRTARVPATNMPVAHTVISCGQTTSIKFKSYTSHIVHHTLNIAHLFSFNNSNCLHYYPANLDDISAGYKIPPKLIMLIG